MSRRQIRDYRTQSFGSFPMLRLRKPLPDINLHDYATAATRDGTDLGTRVKDPPKIFTCKSTGKKFTFWDNYVEHRKQQGPPLDFYSYSDVHDGRVYSYRGNLRQHDRVLAVLRGQNKAADRRRELKDRIEFDAKPVKTYFEGKARKAQDRANEKKFETSSLVLPRDYEDLPDWVAKMRQKPAKASHSGWSHSDTADSWFLDGKTRSTHDDLADFYQDCYGKKMVHPKFNSLVLPG